MKTADLIDHHAAELALIHLPWRNFGTKAFIAGPAQTVKCHEDNSLIRAQLEQAGAGHILVVDAGGSTRIAVLGDILADLAIKNGWSGIVLHGTIRDSVEITAMPTLVFALATSPAKSAKDGWSKVGQSISLGGVTVVPGDWIYADGDGVLHSSKKLI